MFGTEVFVNTEDEKFLSLLYYNTAFLLYEWK